MKKTTKNLLKLTTTVMLIAAMAVLSACGSTDHGDKYRVVTEPTFAPFDTTDEDGNLVGFDMDLLNAIAEDQGFEVEYSAVEFDALIPSLESDQADIIAAGMNADDPARQKKVTFSDTYYDSGLVVLVKADNETIKGIDDFKPDMKVAAQIGTTSADKATELKEKGAIAEAVILNKNSDAILQLNNGDIQAIIIDKPVAEAYMHAKPDTVKAVGAVMNAESYGFAVQKGNTELAEKINAGLKNLKENGTFDKLVAKWFK